MRVPADVHACGSLAAGDAHARQGQSNVGFQLIVQDEHWYYHTLFLPKGKVQLADKLWLKIA